jgi:DNA-binding protein YbaB
MDLMGMMGKLKETQQNGRKKNVWIQFSLMNKVQFIKVTITANRTIKSVTIADDLLQDKEQLEDYMILVMNKAIASKVNEAELEVAKWICQ